MKILIIEDDPAIRVTLQELLELNGYEVITAADGREGILRAEESPDFIFCDVSMPELDGYGVIEAVRKRERGQWVPFVFLTAKADRADQRRGMALGADDYVTKPFTEKEVLDVIAARMHRQRPLRERVDQLVEQRRRQAGADWSHELLTPLNGMLGGLQLLELEIETISREELREMVGLIRGGVERQERLSRKLIRYFELERLKDAPRPPGRFACEADAAILGGAGRVAAQAQRTADLSVRGAPGTVALPETFLEDGVAELVDNALRFSAPGRPVRVTGEKCDGAYRIEVTDQGPGMSAEERANSAPFTQFGRDKLEQQGLGLGLSIARLVAQIGGGSLSLTDGPDGRGLRATLLVATI